jgi:hypothetical protein
LLKLPLPEDRSERRRLAYEKEKRFNGVYDGELEHTGFEDKRRRLCRRKF